MLGVLRRARGSRRPFSPASSPSVIFHDGVFSPVPAVRRVIARGARRHETVCRNPRARRLDLDIYAGEVHALLGENGAGKSTFIKVLAGVYPPDAGQIELEGTRAALWAWSPRRCGVHSSGPRAGGHDVRHGEHRPRLRLPASRRTDLVERAPPQVRATAANPGSRHRSRRLRSGACRRRKSRSSRSPAPSQRPMCAFLSSTSPRRACRRKTSHASFGRCNASSSKRSG